jgi:hypothetical protein
LIRLLRWLPAFAGAAYLATVAVLGSQIVHDVGWDTDASGVFTLAERLRGSGPVYLSHQGGWTSLWWMLATRGLPWHAEIWEATGYLFAVIGALLLAWATTRVAGRWAGVTAGAIALVIAGPFTLRALVSLTAHVTNPFGAVVLGAGIVLLTRTTSWPLFVGVGLIAGANAASDPLLWFAGVLPFAFAAALLARATRRVDVAARAGVTVAVTVVSAGVTSLVMRALDFHVVGLDAGLEHLRDLPSNVEHLGRMIALFGGANYAIPGPYPQEPLRAILALLVFAAVAAPVVAAVLLTIRRAEPTTWAYACYWAAASTLLCVIFLITPNAADLGPKSSNYLLTLAPAAGAGLALLASRSRARQLAVGIAVATIAALNVGSIADGQAEVTGLAAIETYERPLQQLLEREGVTRGYAAYWGAQNLSWQTDLRLVVAPIRNCGEQLCPYNVFTIRSWYAPQRGPTFLLVDPTVNAIHAPPFSAQARVTRRFGPMTLYLFDYDIARHVRLAGA